MYSFSAPNRSWCRYNSPSVAAEEQSPAAPNLNVHVGAVSRRWPFFQHFRTCRKNGLSTSLSALCTKNTSCSQVPTSSFPLKIWASLKSISFSTKPFPRTVHALNMGFFMVAEVPLFLSNVNSKYRIVPSFAVACAEPSWSKVGISIWLKT